ncbi:unnamed protein product [Caenorhabditis auriculariae]|uniref:Uncharacterized protein n=1 Tax=Caenorhabditis auriculariae TaxID=2777116 RepID=A0A8S1HG56_9PELO|nr:unnamed protein product [Caenorhabditis auriculariae]
MNEIIFGDPGPGRGIRPGRLLIRKTRKNPKKKTRNHERDNFRGSGPGPRDPSRKASDPEKPGKKSQEKKTRNHEREIFFGDPGPGRRDPSRKASDPENPEKNPKKKRPETMNERFFSGIRAQGRGIRPGRLLIRKTRKNPKKKTRNHEREIFRGSGPGPRDP